MLASVAGTSQGPAATAPPVEGLPSATEALTSPAEPASEPAVEPPAPEPPTPQPSAPEPSTPEPSAPEAAAPEPPGPAQPSTSPGPPPIIGEWSGPPPAVVSGHETVVPAGPAMAPTSVTVMGATTRPKRKFGEPLFPDAVATPAEIPAEEPQESGGIVVAPTALAGWLVVAGGVIAGVSFLLPWADAVLGSRSVDDSYIGHWGLANAPNILLMLASFGIAWLAVAPIKRLAWLRLGALPIVAGGLLLGVTWPYVLGPYGPRLGLWVTVLGGGLLLAGGILALYEGATHRGEGEPEG